MNPHALRRVVGEKLVSNKPTSVEPRTGKADQRDPGEKAKYASLPLRPSDLNAIPSLDKARTEFPPGASDCQPVEEERNAAGASTAQQHTEEISSSAGHKAPPGEFQQGPVPHERSVQDFSGLLGTRAPISFPYTPARPCSSPELDISTPMSALCVSGRNDRRSSLSPMMDDASPMNTSGTCPGSSSTSEIPETPSSSAGKKALRTPFSSTPPSLPRTAPGRRSTMVANRSNLQQMERNSSLRMWWDCDSGRSSGKCLSSARSVSSDDMSVACEQAASFRTPVRVSQRPHAAAWGCTPSPASNGKALLINEVASGSPTRPPSQPLIQPGRDGYISDFFVFTNWTQLENEALHPEEDGAARSDDIPCHHEYRTSLGDRDAAAERTAAATLNWTQLENDALHPEDDGAARSDDICCRHADSTAPQNGDAAAERLPATALNWTQLEDGQSLHSEEDNTEKSDGGPCHHAESTASGEPHAAGERTLAAAFNWTQLEHQDGAESFNASYRCLAGTSVALKMSEEASCWEHEAEGCGPGNGGSSHGTHRPTIKDPQASFHASKESEPSNHSSKIPFTEPAGPVPDGAVARVSSCVFFRRQVDAFKHADRVNQRCWSSCDAKPLNNESAEGDGSLTGKPKIISVQSLHSAAQEGAAQVFCSELPNDGYGSGYTRQFVVGTLQALWQYYRNLQQQEKHLYEVIRDGQPCRIYCDLEYSQQANEDIHGEGLVERLVDEILRQVRDLWGESLDPSKDVLELDSSTCSKFSRHLIINVPGCALRCNATAGNLLQRCLDANPGHFAVRKELQSSNMTPFVDMSVYSRNRHFRVYLSSKATKQARLLPTGRFAGANHSNPRDLWMTSLVCNIDPQSRVLNTPSCSSPSKAGKYIAVVPYRCLEERALGLKDDPGNCTAEILTGLGEDEAQLVQFIQDMASSRSGNQKAVVRSIAACGDAAKFAFNMDGPGSHYCDNIGRAHKSNHVFFIVDLEKRVYAQKCFDPECRSYRSPWHPLPLLSKGSTDA